ncbi:MAG: hypothetical protein KF851_17490 [Pirellulaceae bacterium]|nr:hypothetical protein [Pirellulaceae bacterium]
MNHRTVPIWGWGFIATTLVLVAYWWWLASPLSSRVLGATLALGFGAGALAVVMAIPLLWLMTQRPGRSFWLPIIAVAAAVPVYVHVGAWDSIFGKLGWFTTWYREPLMLSINRWVAAIWIHAAAGAPQVALILMAGHSLGRGVYEDMGLLDAPPHRVFWKVTLPRLLPFAGLGLIWVMVVCAREIAVTDIYQIGTLAEYLYLGYAMGQGMEMLVPWGTDAQQLDVWFQILAIAWMASLVLLAARKYLETEWGLTYSEANDYPNKGGWILGASGWLVAIAIFVIPVVNLVVRSGMTIRRIDGQPTQIIDLTLVPGLMSRCLQDYYWEFQWSLIIAAAGSAVVLITAALFAFWAQTSRLGRTLFLGIISVGLAVPGPMIGGLIFKIALASNHPLWIAWFDRSILAPVMASALFVWPLIALLVWTVFRSGGEHVLRVAELDGAGWWNRFFSMVIGRYRVVLLGIAGVAAVLMFGELSAAQMVQIAGIDTLPRLTLGFLHAGVNEKAAAVTLLTLLFVAGIMIAAWQLFRRFRLGFERESKG